VETQDPSPLAISVSASRKEKELVISFVNARHDADFEIDCTIAGRNLREGKAEILHDADWNVCNTFDNPNRVALRTHPVVVEGSKLRMDLPRLSVATVTVQTA
jgi:alpha-N-arabinofuranosidase